MKTFEYLCWTLTLAGVIFFLDLQYALYKNGVREHSIAAPKQPQSYNPITLDKVQACKQDKDCLLLAELGYYEARSESLLGVWSVMGVALNRVEDKRWPNTLKGVITAPAQFTYRWDGSMKRGYQEKTQLERMYSAAWDVLNGEVELPIGSATHYHTRKVNPWWKGAYSYVMTVDNHVFYE